MTNKNARRPGETLRAMPTHRTSGSTPPMRILVRPTGRRARTTGSSRRLSVAKAAACAPLLPNRRKDRRSDVASFSDCGC